MPDAADSTADTRRAFLQALMCRGSIDLDEGRQLLAAIWDASRPEQPATDPASITAAHLTDLAADVSEAASRLDYEIRSAVDQLSGRRIWALVNLASDPQTQLATGYTAEEMAFIKRLLDAMFDQYNTPRMEVMSIHEMQTSQFARPRPRPTDDDDAANPNSDSPDTRDRAAAPVDRGLKHSDVERVMSSLLSEGWLQLGPGGFYSLTVRALLELRSWLVDAYNDPDASPDEWQRIKTCEACRDILTAGRRCSDRTCLVRLHDACQDAFWRSRRSRNCPRCGAVWSDRHFVGERAVTTTRAYRRGSRRSGGGRRSNLAYEIIRRGADVSEDEPDPGENVPDGG